MASACSGGQEPIAARGGWREVREAERHVWERDAAVLVESYPSDGREGNPVERF
jgi:hypothetical protein